MKAAKGVLLWCLVSLLLATAVVAIADVIDGDDANLVGLPAIDDKGNGNAGLRITTTQSGLNKFLTLLLPLINKQFQTIHLPDIAMDEHTPIGNVHLEVKNIWIHNFNIPHGQVLTSAPDDIHFELGPGIHLHLTANFHWRRHHWPHISGSGSIEATPDGGDIKVKVAITPGAGGHFHVHVDAASCNFHSFNIKFHGGLAWLINIFVRMFKEKIKHAIDDAVAKQIHVLVDKNMNDAFNKIPTQYIIGTGPSAMGVNIPLVQSVANNNWLDLGFAFTVVNPRNGQTCPAPIPDIPLVDAGKTGRNVQVFMGQHFFQCSLWVNYQNGVIDFSMPSNTTNFWLFIPAIPTKWPNAAMKLRVTLNKVGYFSINKTGITASLPLSINMTVEPHSMHACVLGAAASVTLRAWIGKDVAHPTLYLNVTSIKLAWSVIDTAVGPIDLSLLQGLTEMIVPLLIKAFDDSIKNGFPIPVHKGLTLSNDVIVMDNGYLAVEADFSFSSAPPSLAPPTTSVTWIPEDDMTGDDVIHGVA